MNKFENVDVLASLQQIMQQNTAAFQNDFDIDKKILTQAAKSKNAEDKVYLWFSRPNGTHCLRERDVFLRGTREHNTFRFYHEQTKERVLAYAVVLSGMESGKVKGSIYELDYAAKITDKRKYLQANRWPLEQRGLVHGRAEKEKAKVLLRDHQTGSQRKALCASDESKSKLEESMGKWLRVFKFPSVERGTYDRLECTAKYQIYPILGGKVVGDITSADIKALLNHWMNEDYAYTTVKKVYNILTDYFRYLTQQEYIPKNPMAAAPMIKKSNFMASQGKEDLPTFETVTIFTP